LMIRQDWLDALGLPLPVTLDDWYQTLTAFKVNDMAGNGRTVPFSGTFNGSGDSRTALQVFYSAFGFPVGTQDWWFDEDGKVFNIRTTPQFKAFLTEMSKWYAEGLIDLDPGRNESDYYTFVSTGVSGTAIHLSQYIDMYNGFVNSAVPGASLTLVDHPVGAGGKPVRILKRASTQNHYGISKDCEDPALAIKWINFMFSEMGIMANQWGIPGVTYDIVDGKPRYSEWVLKNPDGMTPINAIRSLGIANNVFSITTMEASLARRDIGIEMPFIERSVGKLVEPWPSIMSLEEERSIVNMYNTDYTTYRDEWYGYFIRGEESLDKFDEYVDNLNKIGLIEIQKIRQIQLDRAFGR